MNCNECCEVLNETGVVFLTWGTFLELLASDPFRRALWLVHVSTVIITVKRAVKAPFNNCIRKKQVLDQVRSSTFPNSFYHREQDQWHCNHLAQLLLSESSLEHVNQSYEINQRLSSISLWSFLLIFVARNLGAGSQEEIYSAALSGCLFMTYFTGPDEGVFMT